MWFLNDSVLSWVLVRFFFLVLFRNVVLILTSIGVGFRNWKTDSDNAVFFFSKVLLGLEYS